MIPIAAHGLAEIEDLNHILRNYIIAKFVVLFTAKGRGEG